MEKCVFCLIVDKQIPAKIVYENNDLIAFDSNEPKAPVHIIIIPKRHIPSVNSLNEDDALLMGKMILAAKKLAEAKDINESGYRLVINNGHDAGQTVEHIHLHLMGGQMLDDNMV
jgi:histidine triad (HIT) family protein